MHERAMGAKIRAERWVGQNEWGAEVHDIYRALAYDALYLPNARPSCYVYKYGMIASDPYTYL